MGKIYDQVMMFKAKYPGSITWWRLKKHAKILEDHINPDEEPLFSFAGQKSENTWDFISTAVLCVTNQRIIIGQDHIITGYTMNSITPDMFNDIEVYCGILWGKVTIDTIKEKVVFTNLDKRSLQDIETAVSANMMSQKIKYGSTNKTK